MRDKFGVIHSRQWLAEEGRRDMFGTHLTAEGHCTCEWRCCVMWEGSICICKDCNCSDHERYS